MTAARDVVIIGGGAAGIFAAIHAAEAGARVTVLEKSPKPLTKVEISGGGRCNVTHACADPRELVLSYPRGGRELRGPFSRWHVPHTIDWFAAHGVVLKTEDDGRMFPVTDSSRTVVDAMLAAATGAGATIRTRCGVAAAARRDDGFEVTLDSGEILTCDRLLIATGGMRGGAGARFAESFGHTVLDPVPSLFTFHIDDPRLADLAGVSVPDARIQVVGMKTLVQRGPLLVTHWGLSGPAVLKVSAWGARELSTQDYTFDVAVDWTPSLPSDAVTAAIAAARHDHPRQHPIKGPLLDLPRRLWEKLVAAAGIPDTRVWAELTRDEAKSLTAHIRDAHFPVTGKSLNKDEFVTCGGIPLPEVDLRTMESKRVPGLHFAGEILDIDGITGGFNLQAAWTTGYIAGTSMAGDSQTPGGQRQ